MTDLCVAASGVEEARLYHGLMHCSDWLPTLLSYAELPAQHMPALLDGFDFSEVFRMVPFQSVPISTQPQLIADAARGVFRPLNTSLLHEAMEISVSPRDEILVEMYFTEEYIFGEELVALRSGDYKFIKGTAHGNRSVVDCHCCP